MQQMEIFLGKKSWGKTDKKYQREEAMNDEGKIIETIRMMNESSITPDSFLQ